MSEEQVLFNMKDVETTKTIRDMNYEFSYSRVFKPDDTPAPYFAMHYREDGNPTWYTVNGLLSEDFTACKTEMVIKQIQESLKGQMAGEKHWRDKTSVKSTFMLKGYEIPALEVNDADKLIFNLLTGINVEDIDQRTGLAFGIINGFSGNLALQLNYGFISSLSTKDATSKLAVSNIFLLDEFSHRLIHDGKLKVTFAQVENVKNNCAAKIEEFKKVKPNAKFFDSLIASYPKKIVKQYINIFDKLPEEYKNMYYTTYIFSAILESARNINQELSLRKFISAHMATSKIDEESANV